MPVSILDTRLFTCLGLSSASQSSPLLLPLPLPSLLESVVLVSVAEVRVGSAVDAAISIATMIAMMIMSFDENIFISASFLVC